MKISIFALSVFLISSNLLQAQLVLTHFKTGELQAKTNYKDGTRTDKRKGIKEGLAQAYYQMGSLAYKVNYINNKRDGILTWYDKKGNILSKTHYKMGKIVGKNISYFKNGHIKQSVMYVNDEKEGLQKEYFSNNQLASVVPFFHGKKEGLQKEYTIDGKLYTKVNYKNNFKDGNQTWYDKNGNIIKTQLFKQDRPVNVMKKIEDDYKHSKIIIKGLDFSPKKPQ